MTKKEIFISFFISVLILLIIQSELLYNIYIPPIYLKNNDLYLGSGLLKFGDLIYIFEIIDCHKQGFNVYTNNACVLNKGINYGSFVYGPILLYLPLLKSHLLSQVIVIISFLLLFLYTLAVLRILRPHKTSDFIFFLIVIFSPSSLLLIERMNIDIIIFIFLVILIYKKKQILFDYIIIILSTFLKFYPIVFAIIFLIRKKIGTKEILNFLFCFLLISIFFIIVFDKISSIVFILDNVAKSFKFSFSLNTLKNIMDHLLNLESKFITKLILMLISIVTSFFFYNFFKDHLVPELKKLILTKEFKLFLISALLSYILYILFSNNYYREVYLIGTLPLLKLMIEKKLILPKIIFLLFLIRQIFLLVFLPIYINLDIKSNISAKILVTSKASVDFIYMTLLLTLIFIALNCLFKLNKSKV